MKNLFTVCVYGDFKKDDVRIKIFESWSMTQYSFQNTVTLTSAGYDAMLFSVSDADVPFLQEKSDSKGK